MTPLWVRWCSVVTREIGEIYWVNVNNKHNGISSPYNESISSNMSNTHTDTLHHHHHHLKRHIMVMSLSVVVYLDIPRRIITLQHGPTHCKYTCNVLVCHATVTTRDKVSEQSNKLQLQVKQCVLRAESDLPSRYYNNPRFSVQFCIANTSRSVILNTRLVWGSHTTRT